MTPERQLELFKKVADIESSGEIDQLEWEGLNLWMLFRLELLLKVLKGEEVSSYNGISAEKKLSWRQRLSLRRREQRVGRRLKALLQHVQIPGALLLASESDAHAKDWGEGFYNVHLDPYLEAARAAGIQAEKMHASAEQEESIHSAHVLFSNRELVDEFLWLGRKLSRVQAPEAADRIAKTLNVSLHRVMMHAVTIKQWMALLEPWIQQQQFEAVGVVNFHNPFCMALLEVARIAGCPTFDIQHGKQGELNFSYSSLTSNPGLPGSLLPDGHWNWNRASAQNICDAGAAFNCAIGGNLWFNRNRHAPVGVPREEEAALLQAAASAKHSILFCAQPQQDYVIPHWLGTFADHHPEVVIGIRLHPRQVGADIPGLQRLKQRSNVHVEAATSVGLFHALYSFEIVATRWSTVAFEARAFGKRAWICDAFGLETYRTWIDQGQMEAALTPEVWSQLLNVTDVPEFPEELAPKRSTDQLRACFQFLMNPQSKEQIFDPTEALV